MLQSKHNTNPWISTVSPWAVIQLSLGTITAAFRKEKLWVFQDLYMEGGNIESMQKDGVAHARNLGFFSQKTYLRNGPHFRVTLASQNLGR